MRLSVRSMVACAVMAAGCSTTATVHRASGPNLETEVVHGDPGGVFVRSENGLVYRVDRRTIVDIDHPGNVHLVFGGLFLAAAAIGFGNALTSDIPDERQDGWISGSINLGLGLPLALWGGYVYRRSTKAAEGSGTPVPALVQAMPPDVPLVPPRWPPVPVPPKLTAPPPAVAPASASADEPSVTPASAIEAAPSASPAATGPPGPDQ